MYVPLSAGLAARHNGGDGLELRAERAYDCGFTHSAPFSRCTARALARLDYRTHNVAAPPPRCPTSSRAAYRAFAMARFQSKASAAPVCAPHFCRGLRGRNQYQVVLVSSPAQLSTKATNRSSITG